MYSQSKLLGWKKPCPAGKFWRWIFNTFLTPKKKKVKMSTSNQRQNLNFCQNFNAFSKTVKISTSIQHWINIKNVRWWIPLWQFNILNPKIVKTASLWIKIWMKNLVFRIILANYYFLFVFKIMPTNRFHLHLDAWSVDLYSVCFFIALQIYLFLYWFAHLPIFNMQKFQNCLYLNSRF